MREVLFGKLDCKKQSIRKNSLVVIEKKYGALRSCPRTSIYVSSPGSFSWRLKAAVLPPSLLLPNAKRGDGKAQQSLVFEGAQYSEYCSPLPI